MAYCLQADVENRWASTKWWSDANQDGTIDASIVSAHIGFAEGDINRYVGQQYVVPLTLSDPATAASIKDAAVLLTGHKLAGRVNDRDAQESMADEFDNMIDWLKMVAAGKVKLQGETPTTTTSPSGRPVIGGDAIIFTRDSMDGL